MDVSEVPGDCGRCVEFGNDGVLWLVLLLKNLELMPVHHDFTRKKYLCLDCDSQWCVSRRVSAGTRQDISNVNTCSIATHKVYFPNAQSYVWGFSILFETDHLNPNKNMKCAS